MLKTLLRIVLIGLIVGVIPFGCLFAQSDEEEVGFYVPYKEAKETVDNFLAAYYQGGSPEGMGLKGWLIMVRKNCGWIRRIGDKRVVKPFIELLMDTVRFEELVKWEGMTRRRLDEYHSNIAIVLGRLGDKRAIPALKECLKWKSREMIRMEASIALCFLGEAKVGLPVVEEYASRDTPPFNTWGTHGRGELTLAFFTYDWRVVELPNPNDNKLLIEYMERALNFPSPDLRLGAGLWLITKNKQKYAKPITKVVADVILDRKAIAKELGEYEEAGVLQNAVGILKSIGDKVSKDMLKKLADDENKLVANTARKALKELGGEK